MDLLIETQRAEISGGRSDGPAVTPAGYRAFGHDLKHGQAEYKNKADSGSEYAAIQQLTNPNGGEEVRQTMPMCPSSEVTEI